MTGPGGGAALDELRARLKDWSPDLTGTLLFLVAQRRVLLIHKRRGHGAGRINGPGGKLDAGETPLACAIRETREETGVAVQDVRLAAVMRFVEREGDDWLGYVFVARRYTGTPGATDEAVPEWFPLEHLPLDRMWPDDRLWLPRILAGETLRGDFLFQHGELLAWQIGPLASADVSGAGAGERDSTFE
jgi:8-oxo-dGTP diphosphatase